MAVENSSAKVSSEMVKTLLLQDLENVSQPIDTTSNGLGVNSTQEERLVFCDIVKKVEELLSDKLLKERLDIDTLQEAGIIKTQNNVNNFYQRFIKVKTKLYYKQRRFNLFREESKGYAKLITELNNESIQHTSASKVLEIIKSLIGCFNLDPNRRNFKNK